MENLNYKSIETCYVCGSIDNGIEKFISRVTRNLSDKGEEFIHPKELERQERLKRKTAERNRHNDGIIAGRPVLRGIEDEANRGYGLAGIEASIFERKNSKPRNSKKGYNDSIIIVCGNCGIGIKSKEFYQSLFARFNTILEKNNCHVLFVRGNNDNPSFFNEDKLNFSNIKCVKDYTVVQLKHFNCLCIGGAVSIDRKWKIAQSERLGKKIYWENEGVIYDEDKLNEITSKYNIACVATCTSPSFTFPGTNSFSRSKWISEDKEVSLSLTEERRVMDKIYNKLTENGMKPYMWFYDKFNQSMQNKINDMIFWSINQFNIISFNSVLANNFGIDIKKKIPTNKNIFNNIINDKLNRYNCSLGEPFDDIEDDIVAEDEPMEEMLGEPDEQMPDEQMHAPNEMPINQNAGIPHYNDLIAADEPQALVVDHINVVNHVNNLVGYNRVDAINTATVQEEINRLREDMVRAAVDARDFDNPF
jgi:hypothetical protein